MRSPDPTLPSITFVLSRVQPATKARGNSTHRRGKFGVRRSKSSPSLAPGPHPPRYPPQLDSEFLKTVDYRFSDPPRAPSRSSFALPKDIFDTDAEIEIVMPSPTDSELASTEGSSCSTSSSRKSTQRQRTGPVTAFMQHVYDALRGRWHRDASRAP